MLGRLESDGLAVAIAPRLAIDRNFELRTRRFRQRCHQRHLPFPSIPFGRPLRFHPLKDLLAAFLEGAKALVQGVLNRFSRCRGVAF
jgi:hypothetical protein